jgi:hypothetical protein
MPGIVQVEPEEEPEGVTVVIEHSHGGSDDEHGGGVGGGTSGAAQRGSCRRPRQPVDRAARVSHSKKRLASTPKALMTPENEQEPKDHSRRIR